MFHEVLNISLPYLGYQSDILKKTISISLTRFCIGIKRNLSFTNSYTNCSISNIKDWMTAGVKGIHYVWIYMLLWIYMLSVGEKHLKKHLLPTNW